MKSIVRLFVVTVFSLSSLVLPAHASEPDPPRAEEYQVHPVGWVRKSEGKTYLEINKQYQDALLGVDELESIWVIWWFDRNDTPELRSILQVHPFADPTNPLRGVFATRSPVRPNLIALTRCEVLGVEANLIEIDEIDAYADTPILDIKRYIRGGY